jgi:hypothetical protein
MTSIFYYGLPILIIGFILLFTGYTFSLANKPNVQTIMEGNGPLFIQLIFIPLLLIVGCDVSDSSDRDCHCRCHRCKNSVDPCL